jgi:endopolyphosphatase
MQTFTLRLLILIAVVVSEAFAAPAQVTLQAPAMCMYSSGLSRMIETDATSIVQASDARKLTGRFLHITDMHPDPHYKPHTSIYKSCHRKNPKKKRDRAGFWGTPFELVLDEQGGFQF